MTTAYRLSSSRFPVNSGAGAAIHGGRWNRVGTEAIYTSSSASLAALEVLVHFDVLPRDFVLTEILLPFPVSVKLLEDAELPPDWDSEVVNAATQTVGEEWVREGLHPVMSVPSSVVRSERNLVLNPHHHLFAAIAFGIPVPFRFDSRLR